ncbi:MAG: hypothetical protein O2779_03840 [Nanoarchaeota archaeon]|nr:hypothetical protein [Nanoarchaeota archaeon]
MFGSIERKDKKVVLTNLNSVLIRNKQYKLTKPAEDEFEASFHESYQVAQKLDDIEFMENDRRDNFKKVLRVIGWAKFSIAAIIRYIRQENPRELGHWYGVFWGYIMGLLEGHLLEELDERQQTAVIDAFKNFGRTFKHYGMESPKHQIGKRIRHIIDNHEKVKGNTKVKKFYENL